MTVYENYDVIAFKSCIEKFTVYKAPPAPVPDSKLKRNGPDRILQN